jgi:hypothetical protein
MVTRHSRSSPIPSPRLFCEQFSKLSGKQSGRLLRGLSGEESGELPGPQSGQLFGKLSGEELGELPSELRGRLLRRLPGGFPGESLRKQPRKQSAGQFGELPGE